MTGAGDGVPDVPRVHRCPDEPAHLPAPASLAWLRSGEMARRISELDWSTTPLGPIDAWPQGLRTAVSILVNTRFPMFLFWGPEAICLYNDAYRPSLGAQMHPRGLGMRGEELWSDIWHIIGPQIRAVMEHGDQTWFEDQLVPFDRSGYFEEIYFTYSYSPVYDESDTVGGTLVVCTETTAQVVAQRRLSTLLALSNRPSADVAPLLAQLRDVLAANDVDLPFTLLYRLPSADADPTAALLWTTGLPADDVLGRRAVQLTAEGPWNAALAAMAAGEGRVLRETADLPALPGGHWPEPCRQVVVSPVSTGNGDARYALVTGLSPRKALDDAYTTFLDLLAAGMAAAIGQAESREHERRRAEALGAIDRAKTAFFANVSHEFRTPLTLILGPLEDLLVRHGGPEAVGVDADAAQLAKAHRNATRLLRLVNTLLDIARLDGQQDAVSPVPTDLAMLTAELAGVFDSAASQAGVRLGVDCPPHPRTVLVDRQAWEKIVLNLVSNAVKYTLEGRIDVRLRHDGTTAELTVADTGTGIADQDLDHLFERFYRAGNARSRSFEGSGIGLALVAELVKLHEGTVQVTSAVGRGSTFRVRLPAPYADAEAAPITESLPVLGPEAGIFAAEAARWGAVTAGVTVPGGDAGVDPDAADLLVVDDNADMRAHLSRLLGRHWHVRTANDGRAALEALHRQPPDLVLTDVMMPGIDGLGLLQAVRSDPRLAHLPVILLSARAGPEAAVEGLDAGADDYLVKPFAATELISRVRTNLAASAARQERTRIAEDHARQALSLLAVTRTLNRAQSVVDVRSAGDQLAAYLGASAVDVLTAELPQPDGPGPVDTAGGRATSTPLTAADGRTLGDLRVRWSGQGGDAAQEPGRSLLQVAADITAQALERALRYDREREIARTLQASLLPTRLPDLPSADVAGYYAPAEVGVGGDWYDVTRVGDDLTALVIGDVAGHGLPAASATGRLSHALRAYLAAGSSPGQALTQLNHLACADSETIFATVCCVLVDHARGRLRWSTAGHPQPVLRAGRAVRLLDSAVGLPIGVAADAGYQESEVELSAGDTVVLYTDGLVERRGRGILLEELAAFVEREGVAEAQAVVDSLAQTFLPGSRTDDVAVLALHVTGRPTAGDPGHR